MLDTVAVTGLDACGVPLCVTLVIPDAEPATLFVGDLETLTEVDTESLPVFVLEGMGERLLVVVAELVRVDVRLVVLVVEGVNEFDGELVTDADAEEE